MHIAFVSPSPPDDNVHALAYTAALYTKNLCHALVKENPDTEVTILTVRHDHAASLNHCPFGTLAGNRIAVQHCFAWNTGGLLSLLLRIPWRTYDLVHFQHETFLYGGPFSLLLFPLVVAGIRRSAPVAVTVHHVISPRTINGEFKRIFFSRLPPALIRRGYALFYRLLGLTATRLIVHEPCDQRILTEDYGLSARKISVIPHGATDEREAVPAPREALLRRFRLPPDTDRVFGFFAYFDPSKGMDILVSAFVDYLRTRPHDALLIAGTPNPHYTLGTSMPEELEELRKRAEREGKGRIIWLGHLPEESIAPFYGLIDAVIIPYRRFNGGSAALARVIGHDVPCLLSEAFGACVDQRAMLFPLAAGGLCEKLLEFVRSEDLRSRIHAQIAAWRRECLWPAVGRKTHDLYGELTRAPSVRSILLLGAYGQRNLGDELLLASCLERLPRETCVVASADPDLTAKEHRVRAVPSRFGWSFLRAFWKAKTLVIGGGDQCKLLKASAGRARHSLLLRETLLVLAATLLKKNVMFLGVGIGDIATPLARFLTGATIRLADAVTFRDAESLRTAQRLAPKTPASLGADLAFLQRTDARPPYASSAAFTLGIAPAFDLDRPALFPSICRELGRALDGILAEDPQWEAVLLPFQTDFHPHDDIRTSREILARAERSERCRIDERLDASTAADAFRSLSILWGMRLHSLILATLHAVPFVALIYDLKVRNFLEEIGCREWGIELDASFSAEKLLALHRRLAACAGDVRHHLHNQAERLAARSHVNARLLSRIAAACSPATDRLPSPFLPESSSAPSS